MKQGKDAVRNKLFIKDIENISGIKAHTIRIWEQRYNIIKPKRTDTGIRYYDEEDLRFILNISILNNNGYKISKIAKMGMDAILQKCSEFSENKSKYDGQIQQLISSMLSFDEKEFNKILSINILKTGLEQTMLQIVFPFMEQVGTLWLSGTIHPAHEHFISNLIRQKLFVAIDNVTVSPTHESKKFLVFVPAGETHDLGILFSNYVLRCRGHHVIYLGSQTPYEELYKIFDMQKPDYIFSIITSLNSNVGIQAFINNMAKNWKDTTVLLSGNQVTGKKDLKLAPNIHLLQSPGELPEYLTDLKENLRYNKNIKNFSQTLNPVFK